MNLLRFTDGVDVDVQGRLRMIRLRDGLYVVGRGMMIPVESKREACEIIASMKGEER